MEVDSCKTENSKSNACTKCHFVVIRMYNFNIIFVLFTIDGVIDFKHFIEHLIICFIWGKNSFFFSLVFISVPSYIDLFLQFLIYIYIVTQASASNIQRWLQCSFIEFLRVIDCIKKGEQKMEKIEKYKCRQKSAGIEWIWRRMVNEKKFMLDFF